MDKINKIIVHPLWKKSVEQIKECEQKRIFCKHDIRHFLDLARIAMIENLKNDLNISEENIYATALLHDIGRHIQYTDGISHDIASVEIAKIILSDCGFDEENKLQILTAISDHRKNDSLNKLSELIYKADKLSRNCMFCKAYKECNWSEEKRIIR